MTLLTLLFKFLAQRTKYYMERGENPIEVWDFERLSKEIHYHLLEVTLVDNDYFEDIQRLVLSITGKSFDKIEFFNFISRYMKFEKFPIFELSFSYILRRCEHMENAYAFFFFAEYTLMEIWRRMYSDNNFSMLNRFDEIHELYVEGMEDWLTISKKYHL